MNYKTFFKFGSWTLIVTAGFHALSFIGQPEPANDTERQLMDLMANYKQDLGAGIMRSTKDIFTFLSLCMSFLCLFAGISNLIVSKYFDNEALAKRMITFNVIFWTVVLVPLYLLTFLPPQVCFTLAWLGFVGAFVAARRR
ncbi:MAG: hypothetical protein IPJ82_12190 [Lewinellaceae bacterium]|nr:hypothetical protein [Lewinellaceae bacterium]